MSSSGSAAFIAFVLGEAIGGLLMLVSVVFVARRIGFEGAGDINLVGRVRLSNLSHASLFFLVGAVFAGGSIYLMLNSTSESSVTSGTATTAPSVTRLSAKAKAKVRTAPQVVRIAGRTIGARASVEHAPEAGFTYGVENTLDGDRATAWNGIGPSANATLTYTFDRPVRLARIVLLNGYAKSEKAFAENARLRQVSIATDSRRLTHTLTDTPQWQVVAGSFGVTRLVRITIGSVYPGTRFNDAALTEIAFWGTFDVQ